MLECTSAGLLSANVILDAQHRACRNLLRQVPLKLHLWIGLMGYSMGGYLAVRAAAFEYRLAAVMAVDGVYDVFQAFTAWLPPDAKVAFDAGDYQKANRIMEPLRPPGISPIAPKWGCEHGIWCFKADSVCDFMSKTRPFTLKDVARLVKCPVWVGEAAADIFFQGQPEPVKNALGDLAYYKCLTADDGASSHCHVGALR
jgi:pimeloyl-ACP methyl ester carboxylesterase